MNLLVHVLELGPDAGQPAVSFSLEGGLGLDQQGLSAIQAKTSLSEPARELLLGDLLLRKVIPCRLESGLTSRLSSLKTLMMCQDTRFTFVQLGLVILLAGLVGLLAGVDGLDVILLALLL